MKNKWQGKTVFITGANGFLGSHLVKRAIDYRMQVFAFIKEKIEPSLFNYEKLDKKVKLINGDLKDRKLIFSVFKNNKIDLCLHVAAQAIVGVANSSPLATFETNIEGTWNILEAARVYGCSAVVVASSDKAYGEHQKLPYTEDSCLQALHPYDASKACTDILSRTYAFTYDLAVAVTRCANIYGPGDFNFSRIIPDTFKRLIKGKNPEIRSDGTPLRDYIYVDDVVDAYWKLAASINNKQVKGKAFNFGINKPISVISLVEKMIKISGKKNLTPVILGKGKTQGEIIRQYLSSKKANQVLKWKPEFDIDSGLRKTYQWYKEYFNER